MHFIKNNIVGVLCTTGGQTEIAVSIITCFDIGFMPVIHLLLFGGFVFSKYVKTKNICFRQ